MKVTKTRIAFLSAITFSLVIFGAPSSQSAPIAPIMLTSTLSFDPLYASNSVPPIQFGSLLVFAAADKSHGMELWISNGSVAGTHIVKDINATGDSNPSQFQVFNGKVFFSADDGVHGRQIWSSDGTEKGTSLFVQANLTGSSYPSPIFVSGKRFFFVANTDRQFGIWVSDGSAGSAHLLKKLPNEDFGLSDTTHFTTMGTNVYFIAGDDPNTYPTLWVSDGTIEGTKQVVQDASRLVLVNATSPVSFPVVLNSRLYFWARDRQLWSSDGTDAGTNLVKVPNPNGESANIEGGFLFNSTSSSNSSIFRSKLFINGGGAAYGLWSTDGTASGFQKFDHLGMDEHFQSLATIILGNTMVIFNQNSAGAILIWSSDGTAAGTKQLLATPAGGELKILSVTKSLIVFNRRNSGTSETVIGVTDGTKLKTKFMQASDQSSFGVASSAITASTSVAFFVDYFLQGKGFGGQLWFTDGTSKGARYLKINPKGPSDAHYLTKVGNKLYFFANDGTHGFQLWDLAGVIAS